MVDPAPEAHRVRANLFARPTEWRFADGRLHWRAIDAESGGDVAAADVASIRLTTEPGAWGAPRTHAILRTKDGRRLLISSADQTGLYSREDRSATFRPLVRRLIGAVVAANPAARLRSGVTPFHYWGTIIALALVLAMVAGLYVASGGAIFTPRLLLGLALIGFGAPSLVRWLRANKPAGFDAANPPL